MRVTADEATPVRTRVANWDRSPCKRCLKTNPPDGSIVVKVFGLGWWHDECYRIINPNFYVGLDEQLKTGVPDFIPRSSDYQKIVGQLQTAKNIYEVPREMILFRPNDGTLFHTYALSEHNGLWVLNEKRGGGERQWDGVSKDASSERHAVARRSLRQLKDILNSLDL